MTEAASSRGLALRTETDARVLSEIRRRGSTSRVDIAAALDLSPATVTAVASSLLAEDLVREVAQSPGAGAPGRGRPRVRLELNPEARLFAGAKLSDAAITVGVMNFSGELLASDASPLAALPISPDRLTDALEGGLARALNAAGRSRREITSFGLGVPGFVEQKTGRCHWSPLMTRGEVDLKALLAARLGVPVHVDNDANLATLAELWYGHGREADDFLVVTVEHGVGLGVVLGGKLFRGARGLGAEFGHMKMQYGGALCRCGQRGCLEAYVADYAIEREAAAALAQHADDPTDAQPLERLAVLAEAGDEIAATIYARAGRMLGLGIANLVNIFDPPLVVLAGERIRHHHLLVDEMERTLAANTLAADRPPLDLRVHRWGDELWARGAGSLAIDSTFGLS